MAALFRLSRHADPQCRQSAPRSAQGRARPFFAEDIERLQSRYGPYVLFSSNFSLANHFMPGFVRMRFASRPSEEAEAYKWAVYEHKCRLFEAFKDLVPKLARAIAPTNLVIRPHPSENADSWRQVATEPNIHVVHEGPIAPWIMAATALLHNGCTSAIEAAVTGTPAYAYRPVRAQGLDIDLPNAVSRNYDTADDIIDALRAGLGKPQAGGAMRPEYREILAEHIASLDGPLSCGAHHRKPLDPSRRARIHALSRKPCPPRRPCGS